MMFVPEPPLRPAMPLGVPAYFHTMLHLRPAPHFRAPALIGVWPMIVGPVLTALVLY